MGAATARFMWASPLFLPKDAWYCRDTAGRVPLNTKDWKRPQMKSLPGTERTILEMKDITKRFSGVLALDHAELKVEQGEIHSLVGQNGAGKSTMMKILAGMYSADKGTIVLDGKVVILKHPREALQKGIVTVYQELSLLSNLTVAENIYLRVPEKPSFADQATKSSLIVRKNKH